MTDGTNILNINGVVTPPLDIQQTHGQIVSCLRIRIQYLSIESLAINYCSPIDLSKLSDPNLCLPYDAAFEKLSSFVNASK